jgi:uncharacterized membrane protein (DUF485 family)
MKGIGKRVTRYIAFSILLFLIVMTVAALVNMREEGSLDDLDAESIQKAVNGG